MRDDEEADESDGALGPADELDIESGTEDEGTGQGLTRPGKRTFDALRLHPNGVANWMHTPNCSACLQFVCSCPDPCLLKVRAHHGDGAVTAIYEFRKSWQNRMQRAGLGKTDTLHVARRLAGALRWRDEDVHGWLCGGWSGWSV